MNIHKMTNRGPSIGEADIERVEKRIKAKLPVPYRRFILEFNGGHPEPSVFGKQCLRRVLAYFCSIRAHVEHRDLLDQYARTREWMPPEVIPIGADECGNRVCLAIKGKNRGKVYFWDDEGSAERIDPRIKFPWLDLGNDYVFKEDDWPGYPDLTLIADSFTEFLDSFHDPDIDEPKVRRKRPK